VVKVLRAPVTVEHSSTGSVYKIGPQLFAGLLNSKDPKPVLVQDAQPDNIEATAIGPDTRSAAPDSRSIIPAPRNLPTTLSLVRAMPPRQAELIWMTFQHNFVPSEDPDDMPAWLRDERKPSRSMWDQIDSDEGWTTSSSESIQHVPASFAVQRAVTPLPYVSREPPRILSMTQRYDATHDPEMYAAQAELQNPVQPSAPTTIVAVDAASNRGQTSLPTMQTPIQSEVSRSAEPQIQIGASQSLNPTSAMSVIPSSSGQFPAPMVTSQQTLSRSEQITTSFPQPSTTSATTGSMPQSIAGPSRPGRGGQSSGYDDQQRSASTYDQRGQDSSAPRDYPSSSYYDSNVQPRTYQGRSNASMPYDERTYDGGYRSGANRYGGRHDYGSGGDYGRSGSSDRFGDRASSRREDVQNRAGYYGSQGSRNDRDTYNSGSSYNVSREQDYRGGDYYRSGRDSGYIDDRSGDGGRADYGGRRESYDRGGYQEEQPARDDLGRTQSSGRKRPREETSEDVERESRRDAQRRR